MIPAIVKPSRPLLLLILALLCLLAAGALQTRQNYLRRGFIPGLPQPIAHGGVQPGLNVALEQYDDAQLTSELQQIAASGVGLVKHSFYYRPQYNWPESDRILAAVDKVDIQLAALLDGDPGRDFAPPADPSVFAAWAGNFARRYGEQIRYYFIWDEPNLSSHWGFQPVNAAEYAALLAASARAIREADADAVIVAAPLAPTTETGPENLADPLYLQQLYDAGTGDVFDAAAAKPYGFHSGPLDRTVDIDQLNFSRAILLREVMVRNADGHKALFAGNWGWNALPSDWQGPPSIWGQTDPQRRSEYTSQALARARAEWPWMGLMFLEIWQAPVPDNDPRHGFDVQGSDLEAELPGLTTSAQQAYPGFHPADPLLPAQDYQGGWRFSPLYGADISQTGDTLTFRFWGTAAGLRVRRADYRARLYVTIDDEPAPSLPHDGDGAALVLTSPDLDEDYLDIVPVAANLPAGPHVMTVEAYRGWGQWALNGFSVGYHPDSTTTLIALAALLVGALSFGALSVRDFRRVDWRASGSVWSRRYRRLQERWRLLLTLLAAGIVALTGWLTWGEQAAGIYRRLGDTGQLTLTAVAASLFYVAPAFLIYLPALILLFFLIVARPAWGLALVAFSFPFYVLPKPMLGYRFSPVEIFLVTTDVATIAAYAARLRQQFAEPALQSHDTLSVLREAQLRLSSRLLTADYAVVFFVLVATLSLFFTARLDVAQNEWRVVVVEPALFYLLIRLIRPSSKEMWTIVDAFVLGGVVVAVYGLWRYALGLNVITVGGGLARLRSIYGSPNNVALFLGRILPFLLALAIMGRASPRRRFLYAIALLPVCAALILTFSKGGLFLGVPAGFGVVVLLWLRSTHRPLWPWLLAGFVLVIATLVTILTVPGLSARLDLSGATTVFRLSLWQSSLNMFADHLLFGVGLDNFLYAYRGRYILESAWQEPNLNHPHNLILDFATRLGLAGLLAGAWLFRELFRNLWHLPWRILARVPAEWRPVAIAVAGSIAQMLAHGMVDHSFFLVDLAFVFFLLLGLVIWLRETYTVT